MYLFLHEVTLVLDLTRRKPYDAPAYIFDHGGQRALTTDPSVGTRYGVLYFDTMDRPCVIPDDVESARRDDVCVARSCVE